MKIVTAELIAQALAIGSEGNAWIEGPASDVTIDGVIDLEKAAAWLEAEIR